MPGSCWKERVETGCHVECSFCWVELLEACCYCRVLEHCRALGALILPCRMLGYTGNNCWKMPAQNEPCSCCSFLVVELILYEELLVVAGLRVETLGMKNLSLDLHWILLDSSWTEVFEESLLGSSLSFPLEIILFAELLFLYLSG